jgi:hypothetical protein
MCGVLPALSHTSSRRLVKNRDNFVFYQHSKCAVSEWIHVWAYFQGSAQWGSRVCRGPAQQTSDTIGRGGGDDRLLELLSNTCQFTVT